MAKKRRMETPEVPTTVEPVVRHARIELPDEIYERLKKMADRSLLSISAYIRQAVLLRISEDEAKAKKER